MPRRKRRRSALSQSKTESGPYRKPDSMEKCLPMILPYLPLKDLAILQQSCSLFAPFVDKIIASGKHIRIDKDFIERFPVAVNKQLYNQIGAHKTSVTVSGLTKEEFPPLSFFFKSVTHVNVEKMEISGEDVSYFPDVPSIKFSKCHIQENSLIALLKPGRSLLSLHFYHVHIDYARCEQSWSDFLERLQHITFEGFKQYIDLQKAHNLVSVTTRGTENNIRLPNFFIFERFYHLRDYSYDVRRLDLEYGVCERPYSFEIEMCINLVPLSKLEFFSIRGLYPERVWNTIQFGKSLKTFQCHTAPITIDKILQLGPGLEYATVYCNWYHEAELHKHFASLRTMKSFSVTSCAPTKGYNPMSSLNEDCKREIIAYLNEDDVTKLLAVVPALSSILPCLKITAKSIEMWPPVSVTEFYEQLGANTTQLRVERITEEEFYNIIPIFKKLQKLELINMQLKDARRVSLVPLIPYLYIGNEKDHSYPVELYRHLNPELLRFDTNNEYFGSMVLTHVQDLSFLVMDTPPRWLNGAKTLLAQNLKLARVTLCMAFFRYFHSDVASLLVSINAESLRYLHLVLPFDERSSLGDEIGGAIRRLCNLEELLIKNCKITTGDAKYLALSKLTALSVYGKEEDDTILEIVKQIPTLKTLTLYKRRESPNELFNGALRRYLETQGKIFELRSVKVCYKNPHMEIRGFTFHFACTN